jgi:hypothetical protein
MPSGRCWSGYDHARLRSQVGEDGEDAAVGLRSFVQVELGEDLLDVGFDGPFGMNSSDAMARLERPLGHEPMPCVSLREDAASPIGSR